MPITKAAGKKRKRPVHNRHNLSKKEIARRVRDLIDRRQLSHFEAAELLGVTERAIRFFLSGERGMRESVYRFLVIEEEKDKLREKELREERLRYLEKEAKKRARKSKLAARKSPIKKTKRKKSPAK